MTRQSYPHHPGWKGDLDTGRNAAISHAAKAPSIQSRALAVIERRNASAEQVADEIGVHWQIARARCSDLRALGMIDDSGARADGALGGKSVVWRATTPLERAAYARAREAAQ